MRTEQEIKARLEMISGMLKEPKDFNHAISLSNRAHELMWVLEMR